MNNFVADRMNLLSTESAFDVLAKAKKLELEGRDIVHLEIGQPDFKTPQNIIDAAQIAMNQGYTGYTPAPGLLETREAIAEYCMKHKNVKTSPEEIVVVPGGKPIMFYTMLTLINPGDEVIYPNPGFPIYESNIKFAGGIPVPMPLLEENGFSLDIEKFKELITDKTKLIILNTPSNPTGGVIPKEDIIAIAEIIKSKDIYVLSDEIYDRIIYDGENFSIASIPEMKDKTIILDGFSKTYSMTGWRLGYGVMNKELASHFTMLMVNSNSCSAAFTQRAAIEALTGPQDAVEEMVIEFKRRRDFIVKALNEIPGVSCLSPKGAFYVFPNIKETGMSSKEFADRLLNEGNVASLAGTAFGSYGEGYLRFSSANSMENLEKAIDYMDKFVRKNLVLSHA
jgi:aspartate/methionine/tyrosine aminotransferase